MKRVKQFLLGLTEIDVKRLAELEAKLNMTITAVIREAIRLFHKKEIK